MSETIPTAMPDLAAIPLGELGGQEGVSAIVDRLLPAARPSRVAFSSGI